MGVFLLVTICYYKISVFLVIYITSPMLSLA